MAYIDMMRRYVREALDSRAAAFTSNPSAHGWRSLEEAMYAHQAVSPGGVLSVSEQQEVVEQVPIVRWVEELHRRAIGIGAGEPPSLSYFRPFTEQEWDLFSGAERFEHEGIYADPKVAEVGNYLILADRNGLEVHVAATTVHAEGDSYTLHCGLAFKETALMAMAEALAQDLSLTLTYEAAKEVLDRYGFQAN